MNSIRILALDVGDKTIGVAVSDPLGIIAQGITTVERIGIKKDTNRIVDYVKEYECSAVVLGLPINLDGSDSVQTQKVYDFKTKLENKFRSTGLSHVKLEWQDERLTTVMAERVLIDADVSRKNRKKVIDKQAAVIILQSYLDRMSNVQS
ncbi:MAG: Holliday junction resolvase RuvX [Clostridiales bacterium]|nr:Holliday junction resolvase RuvX [Clostridiales bacterium]